ncbi:hypothetical protein [Hymenobacter amundsenii]|nr:hypothetical protein [Hymenobacter amundsenii]
MLRYLTLAALLSCGTAFAATAQTNQPETSVPKIETHLAPSDTTNRVEGIYVAPGMTGAPKQRVTTDYDNQPLKSVKAARSKASTLSSEPPKRSRKQRP